MNALNVDLLIRTKVKMNASLHLIESSCSVRYNSARITPLIGFELWVGIAWFVWATLLFRWRGNCWFLNRLLIRWITLHRPYLRVSVFHTFIGLYNFDKFGHFQLLMRRVDPEILVVDHQFVDRPWFLEEPNYALFKPLCHLVVVHRL